jgi:hypothetical protein
MFVTSAVKVAVPGIFDLPMVAFNHSLSLSQLGGRQTQVGGQVYKRSKPELRFSVRMSNAPFLFTKTILAGEPVNVFNHNKMQRDFTYIADIVEGVVRTLDRAPLPNPDFDTNLPDPAHSWAPHRVLNIGRRSGWSQRAAQLPADATRRSAGEVCGQDPAHGADRVHTGHTDSQRHRPLRRLLQGVVQDLVGCCTDQLV